MAKRTAGLLEENAAGGQFEKSMINPQSFKKELLFIYWVGRVEPGLARSACRRFGIDLADE